MVIKKINEFLDWEDEKYPENYIVSFPSGEVIYYEEDDILPLLKRTLIYSDRTAVGHKFSCSDFLAPKVKEYLKNKKLISLPTLKEITGFLIDSGLMMGQFTIYEDRSVDAFGSVNISHRKMKKIPVKFHRCTSDFNCSHNELETLENSPKVVHGTFDCSYNKLKDLKGGPKDVSRFYNCSHNELITLEGSPITVRDFNCSSNFLRNLDRAPITTGKLIRNDNLFNDKTL
jgi:hypothetical protein